jgi:hypothetical protein
VTFLPLSSDESADWLARHGVEAEAGPATLASLFARAEGLDPGEELELADFAG